jgi:dihydrofolate synthase/folylpolyglutamate synthase
MLDQYVFEALNNPGNAKISPGIERVVRVLLALNNPQHKYKVIHITGSNGKGSTAAFIETGLVHAGYKVGKFTSPHIKIINETIAINHEPITNTDLESNFFLIEDVCKQLDIILSPFEILTVIMFNYCASSGIDYLVLEVGMGGVDDATNVVNSLISIITNISLEHTKYLGNSLIDIAKAKAGIIKSGLTIIADNAPELFAEVTAQTSNYINVLHYYDFNVRLNYDKFQTIIELNNVDETTQIFTLNLFGNFQAYNFLCAYHSLKYLQINPQSINYAAENTKNPGRFEVRGYNPLLILDATHNLAGANSLVNSLAIRFDPDDVVIISSILADKDITNILHEFSKIANNIICTTISNNSRALSARDLAKTANIYFNNIILEDNPNIALEIARNMNKKVILITGSIYLLSYFY